MITRRTCREWAVQLLFQEDLNPAENMDSAFEKFWEGRETDPKARAFTEDLVRGVLEKRREMDRKVTEVAENWDIRRIAIVELNVMRMALYEMLYRKDIPPVVIINEAVDIAKFFGTRESGRFVNGILDRVRKQLDRPSRTAETSRK